MASSYDPFLRQRRARPQWQATEDRRQQQRRQSQSSSSSHGRGQHTEKNSYTLNNPLAILIVSLSGLGLWYTTPVSDWITTLMVQQVPLQADVALGKAAAQDFPFADSYDPHWSPLVQEIGRDLVGTLRHASVDEILRQSSKESTSSSTGWFHDTITFVQDAWQQVSPTPPRQHDQYQWNFGIVRADMVNAFALPGGTIRVTDQLLQQLQPTRGELASLLGHEIGHVVWRHSQRRVVQQQLWQWLLKTLTYEDGDNDRESFGEALGELLLHSAHWLGQQQFSRQDEYQADATGWTLLVQSQLYHPQAMQSLLQKLWTLGEGGGGGDTKQAQQAPPQLDWLSTHPATQDRIQSLQDKWDHNCSPRQQRAWNRERIR